MDSRRTLKGKPQTSDRRPELKIKSLLSGGALVCTALVAIALILSARPLSAETLLNVTEQQTGKGSTPPTYMPAAITDEAPSTGDLGKAMSAPAAEKQFAVAPAPYVATAYTLRGRTASGLMVSKGLIAADPRVLPLGSRVRLEAGVFSGEYLVADTGGAVHGRRVDIWTPSIKEAMRFGRRTIKLTVLSFGGKRHAHQPTGK
jgi:3D (Asp-Asp-Asp) domain-containing protein